ncbi:glycosyl transferase, family 14 [Artemisia annua]|uniref:Glycosyl transferase, family 14 n=1 Tax=Artemisia annua TaxID=35608 RepID=A0A2U1LS63_ARTAN|nr:glycosyl transferase, family 14 [Artemisia annua]
MMKFTNILHSFILGFTNSTFHVVKFLGLATLLLLVVGASSSYFQNGTSSTPAAVPNNKEHEVIPTVPSTRPPGDPPVLAYWIYGSSGDSQRMVRLLKATYHPRNQYLLLLDASSSASERTDLALSIQADPLFNAFENVNVVGRSYGVNQMGGSGLAAMLHASALLLKITANWDWFIPLSAAYDYPLYTQDDILHGFTFLPRDLNFVHFSNNTPSPDDQDERVRQVVVDPSLYTGKSSPIFNAKGTRNAPNTFKILAGSPWVILSRSLIDFCVKGWDNFPRKLLMYMSNMPSPLEFYFQTLICNTPSFHNTTVDNDLRYVMSKNDTLSKIGEFPIVARPFENENEALLQEIDNKILNRSANGVVPGKWSLEHTTNNVTGNNGNKQRDGRRWGDINSVKASPRGVQLGLALSKLANEGIMRFDGCPRPSILLNR